MPYLNVQDGTEVFYECYGKGEPLIFIHGLGASSSMYKPQVSYLKNFFKVVLIDLRGNGKSGKLACDTQEVLGRQTEDIKQVLQHLSIETAIFIGVSYGGVLIQMLAVTYPKTVKALIISDSFCDTTVDSFQKLLAMISVNQTWILHMPKSWLGKLTRLSYKNWELAGMEMENVILNMRKRETILQRKAINKVRLNKHLKLLDTPTLCIVGGHTNLGVHMMKQVRNFIKNSELKIIENSFDPSNLCQPEIFNKIVYEFVKKLS